MKRKTASFTGMRPIFTGSPSIVQGGFNLDVENQHFAVGDTVPAGTLAIKDEVKRTVQVIKTAKVVEVDAENTKKVSLYVDEFYEPCFAVGDLVLKDGTAATAIADVPTIEKIERNGNNYIVTLSKAIAGLVKDDVLVEVVSDGQTAAKSKERGTSNSVLIADVEVGEFENLCRCFCRHHAIRNVRKTCAAYPCRAKGHYGRLLERESPREINEITLTKISVTT